MPHYQVITLDVHGNPNEGFELNNLHESGFFIKDAPESPSTKELVCALKALGFLRLNARASRISHEWLGDSYELFHDLYGPICHLRELDEEAFERKTASKWMFDRPLVYVDAKIFDWGKLK